MVLQEDTVSKFIGISALFTSDKNRQNSQTKSYARLDATKICWNER